MAYDFQKDIDVYIARLPELMEHEGKYVAMYDGEVLAIADTTREACKQGWNKLGFRVSLFCKKIGEPFPEPKEIFFDMTAPRKIIKQ